MSRHAMSDVIVLLRRGEEGAMERDRGQCARARSFQRVCAQWYALYFLSFLPLKTAVPAVTDFLTQLLIGIDVLFLSLPFCH